MQSQNLTTKEDLANIKVELLGKINNTKMQLLWAMFVFWLAQVGVFLGFAYKIF